MRLADNKANTNNGAGAAHKKKRVNGRIAAACCLAVLAAILVVLLVDSLIHMFSPSFRIMFGDYTFVAVETDTMSPAIDKGNMIVCRAPSSPDEIAVGDIISYARGNDGTVVTRRVSRIDRDPDTGVVTYETVSDISSSVEGYHPEYDDIVGIFTGRQCGFFGAFFGFTQSSFGATAIFVILIIMIVSALFGGYVGRLKSENRLINSALKKSEKQLESVHLRHENIREITAALDVLDTVTSDAKSRAEKQARNDRLKEFVNAETIELPQTPEVAAVLDSLPAPDTPVSLAAALRSGATLRQAEDGQTLILTGITGGKSFVLTPVQTPDGIILCQQGVRLRSALAPNIEDVGVLSMPDFPEFFEGRPLAKNVDYPLLPEPQGGEFGPNELSAARTSMPLAVAYSVPHPIGQSRLAELGGGAATAQIAHENVKALGSSAQTVRKIDSGANNGQSAFAAYREAAAETEIKQTEELMALLGSVAPPTADEQKRIDEYKAQQKDLKKSRAKKPLTPEQKQARKLASDKKKAEKEAFLGSLSPDERELYLAEQKLIKTRNAAIRKLKRIAADKKILNMLDTADGDR